MSSIKLESNASGTGIFTIASPNSNTNRTLTLPDATGTVQVSGAAISGTTGSFSGDLSFNSGYGSAAVAYGCRAWVNFDGTGTVTIRASGNVTSITDIGTGDYTVNLTNAMPDSNYSIVLGSERNDATETGNICTQGRSTTTFSISTFPYNSATRDDNAHVSAAIFR